MNGLGAAVAVLMAAVLLGLAVQTIGRVRRLHRLHRRTDAARAGLDRALRHRAGTALDLALRQVAVPPGGSPFAARPVNGAAGDASADDPALASAARAVLEPPPLPARGDGAREAAENALGRELAALDRSALSPASSARLADAERQLLLVRRVYHDAVRDTRALRSRALVRWLRLAGTAPLPAYFDIADPVGPEPGVVTQEGGPAELVTVRHAEPAGRRDQAS